MNDLGLGWKDLRNLGVEKYSRLKEVKKAIGYLLQFIAVVIFIYFLFAVASIAEVAYGLDVPYMSFWHEPLRRLLEFLNHLGLL